jgi:hypothetical protein
VEKMSEEGGLEKEVKKQPKFISKESLERFGPIVVPPNATLLRTKKGCVNFYSGEVPESSQSNGWSPIPGGTKSVRFPGYRPKAGAYGKPEYSTKKV